MPDDDGGSRPAVAPLSGFRPDIQVLRGVAVLAVVAFHAGGLLPGGYVGVDMFFVISGYVIGRLLLSEFLETGRLSFKAFYVRRARRLLPALALMLVAVVLVSPLLAPIGAASSTSRTGIAAALFSANFYLYRNSSLGYFAPVATLNPLLHTWSLSVEEQFYFVMPVTLLAAWRLGLRRARPLLVLRIVIGVVLVGSLAACLALSYAGSVGPVDGLRFAFFSPLTRAWEFALGLALVVLPVRWFASDVARRVAIGLGIIALAVAMVLFDDATTFPGAAALVPTIGAALLIYGCTRPTAAAGADQPSHPLGRPLIWLGGLSYAWYLWHWPLIVFAGAFWPQAGRTPLILAAAFSLLPAWLSYRMLEPRFRARPAARTVSTVVLAACCIAAPLAAAALARPITSALNRRSELAGFDASLRAHADLVGRCDNPTPLGKRRTDRCQWGPPDATRSVVLVGDSNAGHFSEAMIGAAKANDADLRIATYDGCPFVDVVVEHLARSARPCRNFVNGTLEDLEAHPPDVVVISNSTGIYVGADANALVDPSSGARATSSDDRAALFEAGLARVVSRLTAAGIKVAVINKVPTPVHWDPLKCSNLVLLVHPGRCSFAAFAVGSDARGATANGVEDRAAADAGATTWSFNDLICPDSECTGQRNGAFVWSNFDHITVTTSRGLTDQASQYLARELGP